MVEVDVTRLIQRLVEEFPEDTHPDIAAKIRDLEKTYKQEVITRELLGKIGVSVLSYGPQEDTVSDQVVDSQDT
jgi:hypothetical protein